MTAWNIGNSLPSSAEPSPRSEELLAEALARIARAAGAAIVVVGRQRSRLAELARGLVSARLLPVAAVEGVRKA